MARPGRILGTASILMPLICMLVICAPCAAAQTGSATPAQARAIAAGFVGKAKASGLRTVGLVNGPRGWVEGKCYKFSAPLGPKRTYPIGTRQDFRAVVLVQQQTGRVIEYSIWDAGYEGATGYEKPVPKSRMIGEGKALSMASELLRKAGVSITGLRADPIRMRAYQPVEGRNSYVYSIVLRKYRSLPGACEVELPTRASIDLNAVTGELLRYGFLDQPVSTRLVPPGITRERAVEIVRQTNPKGRNLYGEWGSATSRLCVGSTAYTDGPQRYTWHVTIHYKSREHWRGREDARV